MKNIYSKGVTWDKIIFLIIIQCSLFTVQSFAQWTSLNTSTTNFLFNVDFPSDDTGFVVQDNGYVRKSTDGGQSWSLVTSSALVSDISFVTNDSGWAIFGNEILRTDDGGINWNVVYTDPNTIFFWRVYAYSSNRIYAIGINSTYDSAIVTRSVDVGITWVRSTFFEGFGTANAISFPVPSVGYIADLSQTVYKSTDSGQTWVDVYTDANYSYNSVCFISPDTGFILSTIIQMTTNGGLNWNIPNTNGINTAWYDMEFINDSIGFVVGGDGISSGSILKTVDRGFNWFLDTANVQTFNALFFTKNKVGFTSGTGGVLLKYEGTVSIAENVLSVGKISILPNPLVTRSRLTFKNPGKEKFLFTLYDITGRVVETHNNASVHDNEIILTKGSKQAGVYLFNLLNEKTGERWNGKIVISDRVTK